MGELDGKVAVITGAGSGMARAATHVFVREGAKVLAADLGKHNITVNTVLPGYTLTDRQKELAEKAAARTGTTPEKIIKSWEAQIPLERTARPEEIAAAVVFLASEKASYITGAVLPVDGGAIRTIV